MMSQPRGRRLRAVLSLRQRSASQSDQSRRCTTQPAAGSGKDEGVSRLTHVELSFLPEHGRVAQWRTEDVQEKEKETEEVR